MALDLSPALLNAANQPTANVRVLVELDTADGTLLLSNEDMWWSGRYYYGRLLSIPEVGADLGAPEAGIGALKTVSFDVANADGMFSGHRPNWLRGRTMRVQEIFMDVASTPLRQTTYLCTAVAMTGPERVRIEAEDLTGTWRRTLWPPLTYTTQMFPALLNGQFGDQGAIGLPIPVAYGRVYCPIRFVDQIPSLSHDGNMDTLWVGPVGLAASYGQAIEQYPPAVAPYINFGSPIFSATVTSVTYLNNVFTAVRIEQNIPQNFTRWVEVTMPTSPTPGEVLVDMLQNSAYGAATKVFGPFSNAIVDSASLLTAFTYYSTNSITFDCAIATQRTVEEWLGSWQHDAQCRLLVRSNQLVLVPQNSRTATFSLTPSNIVARTLTFDDLPIGQELSQQGVTYVDRASDPTSGPTTIFYSAGSGALQVVEAPFIGRQSVAMQAAARWAQQEIYGIRRYGCQVALRGAVTIEECDFGVLTHSLVAASGQLVECIGVSRAGGVYTLTLRETDPAVFQNPTLPGDTVPGSPYGYQRVPYTSGSYMLEATVGFRAIPIYHQLGQTPSLLTPVWITANPTIVVSPYQRMSTTFINDSVYIAVVFNRGTDPVNIEQVIGAWDLYV